MKASGPKHERETIIRFDEESDQAEIWTASVVVYRRLLKRLGRAFLVEDGERHATFKFPADFLILPRKKTRKSLDPAQRAQLASRIARRPEIVGGNKQSTPI